MMVDAGSGYLHWRGEAADATLLLLKPCRRQQRALLQRQQYFSYMIQDILYHAYERSVQIGRSRRIPESDYSKLFLINLP